MESDRLGKSRTPTQGISLSAFQWIQVWIIQIYPHVTQYIGRPHFEVRDSCSSFLWLLDDDGEPLQELVIDLNAQIIPFGNQSPYASHSGEKIFTKEYMYTRFSERFKIIAHLEREPSNTAHTQATADTLPNNEYPSDMELVKLNFFFEQFSRGVNYEWHAQLGPVLSHAAFSANGVSTEHPSSNIIARGLEETGVVLRRGSSI